MRVALVTPRGYMGRGGTFEELWRSSPELKTFSEYWAGRSLGLLVCASFFGEGDELCLLDENRGPIELDRGYDLALVTAMTHQAPRAYQLCDQLRARGVHVAMGGIHASALPEEAAAHADTVLVGEVEETFPRFLDELRAGRAAPLYRQEGPVDLARSPSPRYELLAGERDRVVWVQSSRGCPRACEFCAVSPFFGRRVRHKPLERVIEEVRRARAALPHALLGFADDNLFLDRSHGLGLVEAMSGEPGRWLAQTDVAVADDAELLRRAREAGCAYLFIGFESLRPESLGAIDPAGWKARQRARYREAVERIQGQGIGVFGSFILGLDGDDPGVFDEVADFVIETRMLATLLTALTPLPGTPLRERARAEGRILTDDWSRYDVMNVVMRPRLMTPEELAEGLVGVYRRIYNAEVGRLKARYFREVFARLEPA